MKTKYRLLNRVIILNILVLILTNAILGGVMLYRSMSTSRDHIVARMLDVANCAAASVDGDVLKTLTAEDEGTADYKSVYDSLSVFRDNITLEYIYCIAQKSEDEFVFTIDPSLEDPGKFGEPVAYTEALASAAKGTPSVDKAPYEDAWGRFYSAYSPIYDSEKKIVGIVGVDFAAEWYEKELAANTGIILVIFALSLAAGIIVLFVSTRQIRHGFSQLKNEMLTLSDDINTLAKGTTDAPEANELNDGDEITNVTFKARSMHNVIRSYMNQIKAEANHDSMTGTGNRTLFSDTVSSLDEKILSGTACFSIAVFDINGLKVINDEHGHDEGDKIIKDAAALITDVFGADKVCRIGGDEFIAILEYTSEERIKELISGLNSRIEETNKTEKRKAIPLYIAKGAATYSKDTDKNFNAVFKRADSVMYRDKAAHYLLRGDRRKRDIHTYVNETNDN